MRVAGHVSLGLLVLVSLCFVVGKSQTAPAQTAPAQAAAGAQAASGPVEVPYVAPGLRAELIRYLRSPSGSTSFGVHRSVQVPSGETLTIDADRITDQELTNYRQIGPALGAEESSPRDRSGQPEEPRAVQPGQLSGQVVDASGRPLPGVEVDAWTWHPGNETRTGEDGRFQLNGFEPGEEVEVEFRRAGYSPALFAARQAGTAGWTITLRNDTYLEGRVVGRDGRPVPFARVRAARGPIRNPNVVIGSVWTETTTDSAGKYRLYLEPDTYDLKLRLPNVGVARYEGTRIAAGEKRNFDIRLQPGPAFRAEMVDSETGRPIKGIRLWNGREPGIEGVSNEAGQLTIEDMMPGPFEFYVAAASDPGPSELAGEYARWWSPDAVNPDERLELRDGGRTFQRNFDSLTFNVRDNVVPVRIFLEKAVSISGRVVDPDGMPVAGATVAPAKTGTANSITGDTRYSVRTAADGTFRMRLPASGNAQYNLVAHDGGYQEWRRWANGVGEPFKTQPGDVLSEVTLTLSRPCVVRGRVVDGAGAPLADHRVRTQAADRLANRYYDPQTTTDENGEFELRFVRPGRHYVQADPFWLVADGGESPASKLVTTDPAQPVVDVVLTPESPPTIQQQVIERLRANIRDMRPADGAAEPNGDQAGAERPDESARVIANAEAQASPTGQGSNLLRDIRLAAAPILARMAEEHGYGLAPGQNVRRVAPPFAPIRMEYYGVGHPTQAEAIPAGPGAMVFHWIDGRPKNWGMTFGDPDDPGYSLQGALNVLVGIKSQRIEGPADLLNQRLPGDWVIRPGVSDAEIVGQLQTILQTELSLPIKLEFREVKRPVYVARGEYKLTPLPGYSGEDETHYENETVRSDAIEIFGKQLVPNSGGGGTGDFGAFLAWLGRWIDAPIVSEVTTLPERRLTWTLHGRSPSTAQMRAEDHDPNLVLVNITAQTGLTFTKEDRAVRILFVERTQ